MSKVLVKFVLFFIVLASPVAGQIVEDTNITVGSTGGLSTLTVFQTPEFGINGDSTSIYVSVSVVDSTATLLYYISQLDEGSDWFATNHGDLFNRETIDSGQFDILFDGDQAGALTVEVDQSFFLGVNTGNGYVDEPFRQHFGWGEFLIDQDGELQILDSAVAYDQGGIIVGTSATIPEPSLLGDVNLDGVVDFSDIPAFITVLQSGEFQAEADCNQDGVVDFADIPAFIAILTNQ